MVNTKVDGVDAYAVGDLLTPHPRKPGLYRYYGRADDQIIHSTGEKVLRTHMHSKVQFPLIMSTNFSDKSWASW